MEFSGKTVLITGASGGIGMAISELFGQLGAKVAVVGRNPEKTAEAAKVGNAFYSSTADITDSAESTRVVREVYEQSGRFDVLINNAGAIERADTADTTDEQWLNLIAINMSAPFFMAREAIRVMREQGEGGAIVNVGSINSFIGRKTLMAYSATKGAIVQMTQSMALDCTDDNIRVNAVGPGAIDTPMPFSKHAKPVTKDEMSDVWKTLIPMGRMGQPVEIAKTIAFLASDDASYVTGTCLMADGGVTCQ